MFRHTPVHVEMHHTGKDVTTEPRSKGSKQVSPQEAAAQTTTTSGEEMTKGALVIAR